MMARKKKERRLDIDFVAPYSLEDCAYRMGRLHERRDIPFTPVVLVRLADLDENTWAFQIHEDTPAPVMIHGYFNRLHDDATYVSGVAIIKRHRLYRELLIGLLLILIVALMVGALIVILYLPLFVFFVTRYQSGIEGERARLVRLMGDTLSY